MKVVEPLQNYDSTFHLSKTTNKVRRRVLPLLLHHRHHHHRHRLLVIKHLLLLQVLDHRHIRGYYDVMVIGYRNNGSGNGQHGVRPRGSVSNSSVSDAGSEESYSSTSSSELRREPIDVFEERCMIFLSFPTSLVDFIFDDFFSSFQQLLTHTMMVQVHDII